MAATGEEFDRDQQFQFGEGFFERAAADRYNQFLPGCVTFKSLYGRRRYISVSNDARRPRSSAPQ